MTIPEWAVSLTDTERSFVQACAVLAPIVAAQNEQMRRDLATAAESFRGCFDTSATAAARQAEQSGAGEG